jgi:hypothetical protein
LGFWETILPATSLAFSSTRLVDSACADLDRKKLRLFEWVRALPLIAASPLLRAASVGKVLERLLGAVARSRLEVRREGAEDVPNKLVVEVFVRGFVNFVASLRGASTDCVFPILKMAMRAKTSCRSASPHTTWEAIDSVIVRK